MTKITRRLFVLALLFGSFQIRAQEVKPLTVKNYYKLKWDTPMSSSHYGRKTIIRY